MRNTRLKRFRKKNRPLMITLKMMTIGYLLIFSMSYLATDTAAHFDGQKQVSEVLITSGTWDDEESEEQVAEDEEDMDDSSLAFIDESYENVNTCPASLEVEIVNDGGDMIEDGIYEVYYAETGDPEQDGEKINLNEDEGIIEALQSEETAKLTHEMNQQGVYMFVVYANEDVSREDAVWSEEIIVDCLENERGETEEGSDAPEGEKNQDLDEQQSENKQIEEDDDSEEVEEEEANEATNTDQEPENNEETENNEMDK